MTNDERRAIAAICAPYMVGIVRDRHGETIATYPIGQDDLVDCDLIIIRFADAFDLTIDPDSGFSIQDGCEDYSVVIRDADSIEGTRNWDSRSYMLEA